MTFSICDGSFKPAAFMYPSNSDIGSPDLMAWRVGDKFYLVGERQFWVFIEYFNIKNCNKNKL